MLYAYAILFFFFYKSVIYESIVLYSSSQSSFSLRMVFVIFLTFHILHDCMFVPPVKNVTHVMKLAFHGTIHGTVYTVQC